MSRFANMPNMTDSSGDQKIKRYVHSPLAIEHNGTHAKIQENGKIILTKAAEVKGDVVEFDEIEIPASLIFKLANLLKATRKIEYVSINQVNNNITEE